MKKIIKKIINILLIIIIIILATYFLLRLLGKVSIYEVETGSMEDGIHAGDYILILSKENYHVGEIVTYKQDEYFITHRVIRKEKNKLITKGDANNVEDEAINKDDVVGTVIYNGGILNILIRYKFVIAGLFIAFYLLTTYIDTKIKAKIKKEWYYEKEDANNSNTSFSIIFFCN